MKQMSETESAQPASQAPAPVKVKPLTRGWSHAVAAVASIIFTIVICWVSRHDIPRMISMLIFGLSMVELYTLSAIYHIITWTPEKRRVFRSIDHSNIFVLIAGTYTPLCFNDLSSWQRPTLLIIIWVLAAVGIGTSILTIKLPRWFNAALYVLMGWVVVWAIPSFLQVIPWYAVAVLFLGGILYTVGAVVYAFKWPDPFPRIWGYHEVFHLLVILGSAAFVVCVWLWALPIPRH